MVSTDLNPDDANKPKKRPHEALLTEARARFETCQSAWSEDRQRYKDDTLFASGKQWPENILQERERKRRPALTVDKLSQYIRQIVNDARQNRPSVNVSPVDGFGDPEVAKAFQGIIRHIEQRSNADIAYDTALECAVKGGFGYIRVLTEYAGDDTFDQDIRIQRIRNPLTVWLDQDHQEPDGCDLNYAFVTEDMPAKVYEAKYGKKASTADWESDEYKDSDWFGDHVRVAEYWWREETDRNMHLLEDGTLTNDDEIELAMSEGIEIPPIRETRVVPQSKIMWARINGAEVLEGPQEWPGKFIPIIPVWGNEEDIDGTLRHTGLIHNAKDAQRLYNYSRSAFAERVALAPKAPYVAAAGQVDEYADEWNSANEENRSVLRYDPLDIAGHPVPPPMRQQASDVPTGFSEDMRLAEHDIRAAVGMYEASLGQKSNERSGIAIRARQQRGDTATFHYHDNLSRAIRHLGRIMVDLIPKIYDTPRVIRILGPDGEAAQAQIDPNLPQAVVHQGGQAIYNLGAGRYDVTVSAGPNYQTLRQESAERMSQLLQNDPTLMQVIGDLWVKNQDWPGAQDMAERLKLMLAPPIQQYEQQKGQIPPEAIPMVNQMQQQIQQAEQIMQQMQQQMQELAGENEQLKSGVQVDQLKIQSDQQTKGVENQIRAHEAQIKAYVAETQRIAAMGNIEAKDRELELKVQQLVSKRLDELLASELQTADTRTMQ